MGCCDRRKFVRVLSLLCMVVLAALVSTAEPVAAGRPLHEGRTATWGDGGGLFSLLQLLPKGGGGSGASSCTGGPVRNGGRCP
ncbi:unnamed protein product [Spirodela intermedia]|uniref:Uncharacterized protein n=1 Tax=Spirodela intermedia TaxID=51605 RepID=A0A7I8I884_SPIIN|nr:unnamed protein product [Spirodela intermedia]CAA6653698.1 unnamed protein product [Spirodela intermedia]